MNALSFISTLAVGFPPFGIALAVVSLVIIAGAAVRIRNALWTWQRVRAHRAEIAAIRGETRRDSATVEFVSGALFALGVPALFVTLGIVAGF